MIGSYTLKCMVAGALFYGAIGWLAPLVLGLMLLAETAVEAQNFNLQAYLPQLTAKLLTWYQAAQAATSGGRNRQAQGAPPPPPHAQTRPEEQFPDVNWSTPYGYQQSSPAPQGSWA